MLKIGKRQCLYIIIWISLIQGFLTDYFKLGFINYFCDFLLVICLLLRILGIKHHEWYSHGFRSKPLDIVILFFYIVVFAGWFIHPAPILHALWGIRNYTRFFVFFYLCKREFSIDDYEKIQDWLMKLFPIQCAVTLYQIIVEHLSYDYLGGVFGKYQGCASGLMIYFGLLLIILYTKYDNKEIKFKTLLIYFAVIIGISAYAELKAFFLYFVVMLVLYGLLSKNKVKASVVLLVGLLGAFVGIQILIRFFPQFANFFTVEKIIEQFTNKNASYTFREGLDIGRSSIFYKLDPIIVNWGGNSARWFGLGLGNGDYSSSFSFLNSSFYNAYPRSNYVNFSLSFLFVELGYLGTIAYVSMYFVLEITAMKNYVDDKRSQTLFGVFAPVLCFFLLYYNCSLRTNYAYVVFSVLPIIYAKPHRRCDTKSISGAL